MKTAPVTLTDNEHATVVRTSLLLADKQLRTVNELEQFLRVCNIKEMLERRGVKMKPLPRKIGRRVLKKVVRDCRDYMPVKSSEAFKTLQDTIESWAHQGILPLEAWAPVGLCHYARCILGCPRSIGTTGTKVFVGVGNP